MKSTSALSMDFLTPTTMRSAFLLIISSPGCSVLLLQPKQTKAGVGPEKWDIARTNNKRGSEFGPG